MLISREEIGWKVEVAMGLNDNATWVWPNMVNLNVMDYGLKEVNEMDYGLKEVNEMDYGLKKIKMECD